MWSSDWDALSVWKWKGIKTEGKIMRLMATCRICQGHHEKGTLLKQHVTTRVFPFGNQRKLLHFRPSAATGLRGGTASTSMPLWLWVIWGTATDQLCLIIIFYHTESRITFSTHETYQVQSTSEQEMLDSCCYSFSEREAGWEEGMRLGGSFTVTASYFPLWFLHVNLRVHKVHRNIPELCHFPVIIVSSTVITVI